MFNEIRTSMSINEIGALHFDVRALYPSLLSDWAGNSSLAIHIWSAIYDIVLAISDM